MARVLLREWRGTIPASKGSEKLLRKQKDLEMDIYVSNLAYETTDDGLKAAFAAYGEVTSARVVTNRMTGRSRGFGFVEMPDSAQAGAAIRALDGQRLDDRQIRVEESIPRRLKKKHEGMEAGVVGNEPAGEGSVLDVEPTSFSHGEEDAALDVHSFCVSDMGKKIAVELQERLRIDGPIRISDPVDFLPRGVSVGTWLADPSMKFVHAKDMGRGEVLCELRELSPDSRPARKVVLGLRRKRISELAEELHLPYSVVMDEAVKAEFAVFSPLSGLEPSEVDALRSRLQKAEPRVKATADAIKEKMAVKKLKAAADAKKHDDLQAGKLEAARSRAIAASQQNNFKPETVETVWAVDPGTFAPVSTSEVGTDELTESEFLKKFIADVEKCGYIYNPQDIIRFHTSVKCGSFTLLGGAPGWGKSTLVSLYARALLGSPKPNREKMRYLTIDVNPAWMEPSDVLGYWNLEGKFSCASSGLVPFLRDSVGSEEVRLVCLEEMNLARVEHYFSDFVQLMSRNPDERFLSGVPRNDGDGRDGARLAIPENVRFVGTNNLDETTQCFSARFYDRCNYIELQQTNSLLEFPKFKPSPCRVRFDYGVTFSQYKKWRDDNICAGRLHKEVEGAFREIADWLKKLNLLPSPRVRQAILEYVLNRPFVDGCGLEKFHESKHQRIALDEAIAQRVLARYSPNYWRDESEKDVPKTFNEELFPLSYGLFKGKINQKEIPVRS